MSNYLMRKIFYLAVWLIFLLSTVTFFVAGPRVEAQLFPPVSLFEFFDPETVDGQIYLSGYLDKPRGSRCEPISLTLISYSITDPQITPKIIAVDLQYDEFYSKNSKDNKLANRPGGVQDFGPWRIYLREPPVGPLMRLVGVFSCHPFWDVEITMWVGLTEDVFPGVYHPRTGELTNEL